LCKLPDDWGRISLFASPDVGHAVQPLSNPDSAATRLLSRLVREVPASEVPPCSKVDSVVHAACRRSRSLDRTPSTPSFYRQRVRFLATVNISLTRGYCKESTLGTISQVVAISCRDPLVRCVHPAVAVVPLRKSSRLSRRGENGISANFSTTTI
jgi:hypothetical protein